jgi:hypothetical protein
MSLFKQLAIILTLFLGVILVSVMMLNFPIGERIRPKPAQ